MGRTKKHRELKSLAECVEAMEELLLAMVQGQCLIADRDLAVGKVQMAYEPSIAAAQEQKAAAEGALQDFYYAHLAELEAGGKKRVQLANGVMGRRDNPAELKPLNRNWSWGAIAAAVRERWGKKYFHEPKEALDKVELKESLTEEELRTVGLKLEAGETWYAEPARLPGETEAA